jgi:hypothetical protein
MILKLSKERGMIDKYENIEKSAMTREDLTHFKRSMQYIGNEISQRE